MSYKNEKDRRVTEAFIEHGAAVKRNCYKYLNDKHEAEDICQEVFFKFGDNYEKVPEEKTIAWLMVVSAHLCLDLLRKSGRRHTIVGLPVPDVMDVVGSFDLADELASKENVKERVTVLEQLKEEHPDWYQALILSHVEDLDNITIGELLDQKPELISKWKSRARDWLQKRYEEEYRKK